MQQRPACTNPLDYFPSKPKSRKRQNIIGIVTAILMTTFLIYNVLRRNNHSIYKNRSIIYILEWTVPDISLFQHLERSKYNRSNCSIKNNNCLVTSNKSYFDDVGLFDVIIFNADKIINKHLQRPAIRLEKQIYMFACIESSANYPLHNRALEGFFNRTWTYKLDSDVPFHYFIVRDDQGRIIGPKKDMHWMKVEDMKPVDDAVKAKLKKKSKIAAWFTSNCPDTIKRVWFGEKLQRELNNYGLAVDVFGKCGPYKCNLSMDNYCWKMVEENYLFYLSFENSFSGDYVTEKVLNPLQHYTVPVVFGSANYTRFMPKGIYLDALELGPKKLAKEMYDISINMKRYESFFKWRNHYSYHDASEFPESDNFCMLCKYLNEVIPKDRRNVYKNFDAWWHG